MSINVTNAYLQNFLESYASKTEVEKESGTETTTEKVKKDEKSNTELMEKVLDTYSKNDTVTNQYLNYGNITKVSDILSDDLGTTLLNTNKLIYGTHSTLLNALSTRKGFGSKNVVDTNNTDEMIKKTAKSLKNIK